MALSYLMMVSCLAQDHNHQCVKANSPPVRLLLELLLQFSGQADRSLFPLHMSLRFPFQSTSLYRCISEIAGVFSSNTYLEKGIHFSVVDMAERIGYNKGTGTATSGFSPSG